MYPSCIKFKAADGTLAKGAITFLSQDKEHSHQQIHQFGHRMFEIVCDKLHCSSNHWSRYSDGCEAKIKSGYVVADMLRAAENTDKCSGPLTFKSGSCKYFPNCSYVINRSFQYPMLIM